MSSEPDTLDLEQDGSKEESTLLGNLTVTKLQEQIYKLLYLIVVQILIVVVAVTIPAVTIGIMLALGQAVPVPSMKIHTSGGQAYPIDLTWMVIASVTALMINRLIRINFARWPRVIYKGLVDTVDEADDGSEEGGN